ncbi:hypothetical protein [Bradyrhizobium sp.]|uniref:hypothetical protein n=1 Tax=Bradyrhizobium sp. TaxID=376 RepID=UPI001DD3676E|nr:hypothetical protein [Bradyrhizobium sp.]MBI5322403.1 hypothetical protein [Bradyrhizobium sp.]
MILAILAESALRSLLLGGVVWIGLNLLRVRNPHVHMTCWLVWRRGATNAGAGDALQRRVELAAGNR